MVKQGVDWCNKHLAKDFPNFTFTHVSVANDLYNTSSLKATEYRFPYQNGYFDKIFSFSLFTHMQIEDIQHYFNEINRVLKPGGLAFSTFFLYSDTTETKIATLKNFSFPYKKDRYRLMSENVASGNIAIHKTLLIDMLENANLKCVNIIDGFWKDENWNSQKKEYQDIVIFKHI